MIQVKMHTNGAKEFISIHKINLGGLNRGAK